MNAGMASSVVASSYQCRDLRQESLFSIRGLPVERHSHPCNSDGIGLHKPRKYSGDNMTYIDRRLALKGSLLLAAVLAASVAGAQGPTPSPPGASVYIINLKDGDM